MGPPCKCTSKMIKQKKQKKMACLTRLTAPLADGPRAVWRFVGALLGGVLGGSWVRPGGSLGCAPSSRCRPPHLPPSGGRPAPGRPPRPRLARQLVAAPFLHFFLCASLSGLSRSSDVSCVFAPVSRTLVRGS